MKKIFLALTLFANILFANANPITEEQALKIASKYINNPKLTDNTPQTRSSKTHEQPAYYLFTNSNNKKFVIISGENRLNEVVAYGDCKSNDVNSQSTYVTQFLKDYERIVKAVRTNVLQVPQKQGPIKRRVEPLLTCKWSQYYPFNKYTPVISSRTTPTGCVATATAQLMFYHKWPQNRPTDYVATTGDEARKSTTYWWNDMKNTVAEMRSDRSAQAVGVLMRDIGKAVRMRYYHRGSDSNLQYACNALRHTFNYTVKFLDKDFLPANEFHNEVVKEISEGYPLLVAGGNHAFVFDGYDERGYIHINWGWAGEYDGYFDINTVYLNVQGYGLTGSFWDEMQVLCVHPNNGKATPLPDIPRGLDARATTTFSIDKTKGTRTDSFTAEIKKLGTYSSVKGELGVFTGKVGLALYDSNDKLVKVYQTTGTDHVWASIFTSMSFDVNNFNFDGVPNGNYRLVPVYSEMLDTQTEEHGEWTRVNHTNEMQVQLTDNEVNIETDNPKDIVVMEKAPSLLAPFYFDSGNYAAFSFTMYNPGREEVRGDLVMTLRNTVTNEEFNGFLLTPNVVAQRLGNTSFAINMLPQYYNSGRVGVLGVGTYKVTFSIRATRNGSDVLIPVTMKQPFEIEVLPHNDEGTIEFNYVDFLADGKDVNYTTFELNKTKEIGLQIHSRVSGYQIRNGYRGPIYYRLLDLTNSRWIDLGAVNNVYIPCDAANNATQTRITFPTSKLEANHTYEVHIDVERKGKRQDVWNTLAMRHVFYTINELRPAGIDFSKSDNKTSNAIFSLQGIRLQQSWKNLPKGIYIIDGKKAIKR